MSSIRRLRYAFRTLRKNPGNSLLCLGALTIGIGLCTAMFSVLSGMVLRGLPFEDAERLYNVERASKASRGRSVWANALNFRDYRFVRDYQTPFEELAGMVGDFQLVAHGSQSPAPVETGAVTSEFFRALGIEAVVGRTLEPADDVVGAPRVALLSYRSWRRHYNGATDVLGATLQISGEPATVVGVLPPGFRFPWNAQVWIPLQNFPGVVASKHGWVYTFGRLKEDRTPAAAEEELASVYAAMAGVSDDPDAELGPRLRPLYTAMGHYGWNQVAWVMTVAVLFVLAIACFNVAHLRLVRTLERRRELRIRHALGASFGDLASLVTTESVLLTLGGLLGGSAVAHVLKQGFERFLEQDSNLVWWRYLWDFSFDSRTFAATAAVAVMSAIAASLLPVWLLRRGGEAGVAPGVRSTASRSSSRWSELLVVAQVALTFILLCGTGLLVKSLSNFTENRLPYDPQRLVTSRIQLQAGDYDDARDRGRFYAALERQIAALPGVESASLTSRQAHWPSNMSRLEFPGETYADPGSRPLARWEAVMPDYFATLRAEILEGRGTSFADTAQSRPVAVVNSQFAQRFWPGESALGKIFSTDVGQPGAASQTFTIVGVVADLRMEGVSRRGRDQGGGAGFYVPYDQAPVTNMTLQIRGVFSPAELLPEIRRTVLSLDSEIGVFEAQTVADSIRQQTTDQRLVRDLFTLFGGVALALAALGIFGVISTSVTRRRREIGVRMALGARRDDIQRRFIGHALRHWLLGLAVGLAGALLGGHFLSSFLYRVEPSDTGIWLFSASLLAVTAIVASSLPAHRASRVEPVEVLREE